jgi:hypothetical protein
MPMLGVHKANQHRATPYGRGAGPSIAALLATLGTRADIGAKRKKMEHSGKVAEYLVLAELISKGVEAYLSVAA